MTTDGTNVPGPGENPGAERRMAELTELVGGLAHELRNPLSTMMVNLKLLSEYLDDEKTPVETLRHRAQQKVGVLRREAERLKNLFDEFLNLTGPSGIRRVQADLNGIVIAVGEFFEPQARAQAVSLTLELAPTEVRCHVDERLLRQALLNIMINALEATPEGGALTVTTRRDDDAAYIDIADTGVGISEEDRERIFRPFFSNKARGTGLGLSITQRIVHEHGGTLAFGSSTGQGTTFTIRLPLHGKRG